MLLRLAVLSCVAASAWAASCGGSGIPFRFEVLPSGTPVLGCASPQCFGAENGGRDIMHDAKFNPGPDGEDGFFREGDLSRTRGRWRDAPAQIADCPASFSSSSCSSANQWVGGFNAGRDGDLQLQCCHYDGLRLSTEVGRPIVHAGEVYSGGEVIRDGRQTGFDLIANVKKISSSDGSIAYELTVRRMTCLPDPPEDVNDVGLDSPSDITRILDKAAEDPVQQLSPESGYAGAGGNGGAGGYAVAPQNPPAAPATQDAYVQVGEQVVPVTQPGYYYPVASRLPACFPGDTEVETPSGMKRMDELAIGDLVLTAEGNATTFTPVESFIHRLPEQQATYIVVETADATLKLTPRHFIYKVDCAVSAFNTELVYAEDLKEGDCVYTRQADALISCPIVSLSTESIKGAFAPMTASGDMIVDGVYASCHNIVRQSTLAHTFLQLASAADRSIRSLLGAPVSSEGHLPSTAEFFLSIVEHIIPHKM